MDRYESLDAIVEAASEQPERRVLVDLAAQTQDPLTRWMDESQLLEVAPELGTAHPLLARHGLRQGLRRPVENCCWIATSGG